LNGVDAQPYLKTKNLAVLNGPEILAGARFHSRHLMTLMAESFSSGVEAIGMNTKTLIFSLILLICSCANVKDDLPPDAYLIAGKNRYEMVSGTYCWNDFCSDSFAYFTNKTPIVIKAGQEFEIQLVSGSQFKKGYANLVAVKYFQPQKLESDDPDEVKDLEELRKKYELWEEKLQYERFLASYRMQNRVDLNSKLQKMPYLETGEYIVSVGSWWGRGDIFFDLYIRVEP
jgi:hypothetical protein